MKILALLFLILLVLSGCSSTNEDDVQRDRAMSQIQFLDNRIILMMNKLNNISLENYTVTSHEAMIEEMGEGEENILVSEMVPNTVLTSENNQNIDWHAIRGEIERVNSAWSVIILDLYEIDVNGDMLLEFGRELDIAIININGEDKVGSMSSLSRIYGYLPRFLENIPSEENLRNIKQTKSFLLNAYTGVERRNWIEVGTNVEEATNSFRNVIQNLDYMRDNEFRANRTYVMLNELKRSLEFRNEAIFHINYRNVMQSLNTL